MKHSPNLQPNMPKIKLEDITNIISLLEEKKVLKYRHKGETASVREVFNNTKTCAWYIGKTRREDNSMYDADFITAIIINAIHYHQKTNKKALVIQTTGVYDILKTQADPHAISISEQRDLINKVLSKYVGKKAGDMIEFRLLDDMHPRLFELIRTKGVDGLETEQQIDLSQAPNDSLSLAQYLYRAMKHNKKLEEKMFGLKQGLDQNDELNPYYGMLEVACRLSDFLHGTNTQCGEARQNIYDDIIKTILYGDIKKYPELQTLQQEYIRPKTQGIHDEKPNFNTIYVDGKKFDEYIKETTEIYRNNWHRKLKNALLITLTTLTFAGGIGYYNYNQKKEADEIRIELRQKIKNLRISTGNKRDNSGISPIAGTEYVEPFVLAYAKSLQDIIRTRYGTIHSQEEYIEIRLLEYLSEQSFRDERNEDMYMQTQEKIEFIDNIFIPENRLLLKKIGVKSIPYSQLYENKHIIKNMKSYGGEKFAITNMIDISQALKKGGTKYQDCTIKTLQNFGSGQSGMVDRSSFYLTFEGKYITQDGKSYQILFYDPNGKFEPSILLAYPEDDYDEKVGFIYTTEAGKIVAKDYKALLEKLEIEENK